MSNKLNEWSIMAQLSAHSAPPACSSCRKSIRATNTNIAKESIITLKPNAPILLHLTIKIKLLPCLQYLSESSRHNKSDSWMRMPNNPILSNQMIVQTRTVYHRARRSGPGYCEVYGHSSPTIYHVVAGRIQHSDAAPSERREGSDSRNYR